MAGRKLLIPAKILLVRLGQEARICSISSIAKFCTRGSRRLSARIHKWTSAFWRAHTFPGYVSSERGPGFSKSALYCSTSNRTICPVSSHSARILKAAGSFSLRLYDCNCPSRYGPLKAALKTGDLIAASSRMMKGFICLLTRILTSFLGGLK